MNKVKNKSKSLEELLEEALVPVEEQPYEVPGNWVWVKLGHIVTIGPSKPKLNYVDNESTSFVSMSAVSPEKGEITATEQREFGKVKKGYTYFEEGDILFAKITPCMENGNTAIAQNLLNDFGFGSTEFFVLRSSEQINRKFLYYLLRSESFRKKAKSVMSGAVGQQRVPKSFLENYPFMLPPLAEQERIANKIESLFAKIDEAKQLIDEAKESFELRRAAILDKAFRGELTRSWRENQENLSNAQAWVEEFEKTKLKPKKYKNELDEKFEKQLYGLPDGWKWIKLSSLIESMTYGTSEKTNDDSSGTPVLRMGNLTANGEIIFENLKYLPKDTDSIAGLELEEYDILFNRTNSYELVGKSALIKSELAGKATYASYLIRLRLFDKRFLGEYVCNFINSYFGRSMLLSMVTQQVGQANINSQKLASIFIPLPPKEEVRIINKLLTELDIKNAGSMSLLSTEEINTFKQSILQKAFLGKLGTNNLEEESSIALLKEVLRDSSK